MNCDKDNIVVEKSFNFALQVVALRKYLIYNAPLKEYDISRQVLRSGTSIGANVEEAQGAHSSADFLAKIEIAYKEARESRYWIKLLLKSEYISQTMYDDLYTSAEELCRLLASIIIKTRSNKSSSQ